MELEHGFDREEFHSKFESALRKAKVRPKSVDCTK